MAEGEGGYHEGRLTMRTLLDWKRLKLGLQSGPPIIWVPRASVTKADRAKVLVLGWGWWMLYIGWREPGWQPDKVVVAVSLPLADYEILNAIAEQRGQEGVSQVLQAALTHGIATAVMDAEEQLGEEWLERLLEEYDGPA